MDEWIDRLTEALGQERVTPTEVGVVLKLARDVAHGVERRLAPLSTFVAGLYVGALAGGGMPREEALARAVETATGLIPSAAGTDPEGSPRGEG